MKSLLIGTLEKNKKNQSGLSAANRQTVHPCGGKNSPSGTISTAELKYIKNQLCNGELELSNRRENI